MYSSVFSSIFSFLLQLTCVVFPIIHFLLLFYIKLRYFRFSKKVKKKKNTEISRDSSYTLKKVAFFTSEKSELLSLTPTPTDSKDVYTTVPISSDSRVCFQIAFSPPVLFLIIFHLLSVLKFKPSILRMCYFLFCFLPEKKEDRGGVRNCF